MAATAFRTIGQSVPKPDAWLKATGGATYAGDVRLPGMLEDRVLRSPHAHIEFATDDIVDEAGPIFAEQFDLAFEARDRRIQSARFNLKVADNRLLLH